MGAGGSTPEPGATLEDFRVRFPAAAQRPLSGRSAAAQRPLNGRSVKPRGFAELGIRERGLNKYSFSLDPDYLETLGFTERPLSGR